MSERYDDIGVMFDKAGIGDALFIAVMTDAVVCGRAGREADKQLLDSEKMLELRVFGPDREALFRRDYMGEEFTFRILDDTCGLNYMDEAHYLDIAGKSARGDATVFTTLTGSRYVLPVSLDAEKVTVRTYFQANQENGIEFPVDWRVLGFC